jgi:hypothetical protein
MDAELHDAAAARGLEMGERGFNERHSTEHVDVETGAPTIGGCRDAALRAGGGYHDINPTSLGSDGIYPGGYGGEVFGVNNGADGARSEGRLGRGYALRASRAEGHVHSFGQETFNNAATDAAAGSGDKGGLTGKSEIHGNLFHYWRNGKE